MRHQVSCLFTLALVLVVSGASAFAASDGDTKVAPEQPTVLPEPPEQDLRVIDGDTLKIAPGNHTLIPVRIDLLAGYLVLSDDRLEGQGGVSTTVIILTLITLTLLSLLRRIDPPHTVGCPCYLGGTMDLGSWMVNAGYAVEYKRYSKGYYQTEQDNAEEAQRGLWAGDFTMPWDYRKERR